MESANQLRGKTLLQDLKKIQGKISKLKDKHDYMDQNREEGNHMYISASKDEELF